jgi:hypothetical protein
MHITTEEAVTILNGWKSGETSLDVHVSSVGKARRLQAPVVGISGALVSLSSNEGATELDLTGASFNGDQKGSAIYGPYLICNYGDGDFGSFYARRSLDTQGVISSAERRRHWAEN